MRDVPRCSTSETDSVGIVSPVFTGPLPISESVFFHFTLTVLVTELRAHVGRAAAFMAGTTVFLPQQRKRYTGLCQLSVDVGIIRFCIDAFGFALVGEKKCLQLRVCDIIVQRPGNAQLACWQVHWQ